MSHSSFSLFSSFGELRYELDLFILYFSLLLFLLFFKAAFCMISQIYLVSLIVTSAVSNLFHLLSKFISSLLTFFVSRKLFDSVQTCIHCLSFFFLYYPFFSWYNVSVALIWAVSNRRPKATEKFIPHHRKSELGQL